MNHLDHDPLLALSTGFREITQGITAPPEPWPDRHVALFTVPKKTKKNNRRYFLGGGNRQPGRVGGDTLNSSSLR